MESKASFYLARRPKASKTFVPFLALVSMNRALFSFTKTDKSNVSRSVQKPINKIQNGIFNIGLLRKAK